MILMVACFYLYMQNGWHQSIYDCPATFYAEFDYIIYTGNDPSDVLFLNEIARSNGSKFWAARTFGLYGYIFTDCGHHEYTM